MSCRYWSPFVKDIVPYTPGEQPKVTNLVKLNTNENAYGVSPRVFEALKQTINDNLRLYPDPEATQLCQALANLHQVNKENIFVGNGSDEVLGLAFYTFLKQDAPTLFPDITYSFYPVYCELFDIPYVQIPLDEEFRVNLNDYNRKASAIVLANPNAPTSIALDYETIENWVKAHPQQLIIIDEAYVDFGGQTVIPLIQKYPNILVIRTFSKFYALAGLRVGYAVGHADLIEGLRRVKDSFNSYPLDRLAQAGALAAINDIQWSIDHAKRIIANREKMTNVLKALGFKVLESSANFVFAMHPDFSGETLAKTLRQENIIVRHFNKPRIQNWLRITIGTEEECQALLKVFQKICAK